MKKKFSCEIDCANCAAKVEEAISRIPGVNSVKINFLQQKFVLDADDAVFDEIVRQAVETGKKIEPDFTVEF